MSGGPQLAESNADAVAINLAMRLMLNSMTVSDDSLVELCALAQARAEQLRDIHRRTAELEEQLEAGKATRDQAAFNAQLMEALYDTVCIKWFLSRFFRKLADQLEYQACQQHSHIQPLREIVYAPDGEVESYKIEP